MTKEKVKQLQMQHNLMSQQLAEFEKQNEIFNNQVVELDMTVQSLREFSDLKVGSEILVPLNAGIYAKAELKDNQNLLVNVGAKTTVEKSVLDTKKMMQEQIEEVKKIQGKMSASLDELYTQLKIVETEIGKYSNQ